MNRKRINNNNNIILNDASHSHYKEFLIMHAYVIILQSLPLHKLAYIITLPRVDMATRQQLSKQLIIFKYQR